MAEIPVIGVDFTSAPSKRKPLSVARCDFNGSQLTLTAFEGLTSFSSFEALFHAEGPGAFGLDFPFSQAVKLVRDPAPLLPGLAWPLRWDQFAQRVAALSREEFETALNNYKSQRAKGDKHHLRVADALTNAKSPQMLYRVPVGKMFYQGVKILARTQCSLVPVRRTESERVVFEAYPGVFVRAFAKVGSYKDDRKDTPDKLANRAEILKALISGRFKAGYGFEAVFSPEQAQAMTENGSGDLLDALLCAVQAAWAWSKRKENYGLPPAIDPDILAFEGWIMDPHCCPA